jgi:hypothetical protein
MTNQGNPPSQNSDSNNQNKTRDDNQNPSSSSSSSSSRPNLPPYQALSRLRKDAGLEDRQNFSVQQWPKKKIEPLS